MRLLDLLLLRRALRQENARLRLELEIVRDERDAYRRGERRMAQRARRS